MSATDCDALVVGCGPGGSSAATYLVRAGRRVLVLEKEIFPRFHIGESLLPYNQAILRELGVLPAIQAAGPQPLTIQRTLSPVSSANDLVELIFAHAKDSPLPAIELRVGGERVAPAAAQPEDNNGSELEPLPDLAAKGKPAVPKGRARQAAVSGNLAETAQPYRVWTLRWDLQKYQGRSVQLALSISLDQQPNGLVWRELATKPAIRNTVPHGEL